MQWDTYSVFPRPPHAFNDAHVVQGDGGDEDLGRVRVAELEDEGAPWLVVGPDVLVDQNVEVVLDVEEARCYGGRDEPDDERSRHGRIGKGHVLGRCGWWVEGVGGTDIRATDT